MLPGNGRLEERRQKRRWVRNLAASFLVYLLPLVGPHFVSLLGMVLWMEIAIRRGDREPAWIAMDLALALLAQAAAFLVLIVSSRIRNPFRYVLPIAAAPFLLALVNYGYMVVIPTRFLIEDVESPERAGWSVACTVAGAWIAPVRAGAGLALERAGRAYLVRGGEWIALTMPGCEVRPLGLDAANAGAADASPDGAMLFQRWDVRTQKQTTWLLFAGATEPVELLAPPEEGAWYPTLSADGTAVAWIASARTNEGSAIGYSTRVRRVAENETFSVPIPREASQPQLIGLDAEEIVIAANLNEVLGLDLDGNPRWGPLVPEGIESVLGNFLRLENGFVAWDAYRERGRYRVSFHSASGEGVHEIPKGRSISALSVDPSERLIAISVSPSLSIGSVQDAVYVIRASDGSEVYRRSLPAYSRSQVAFLRSGFLALTLFEDGASRVEVLEVPESAFEGSGPGLTPR